MSNILVNNNFYQGTSSACIIDLIPPVFAGINFLDVESRGQIRAGWATATDANLPIRYEVYIQASTSVALFNVANIIAITPNLQYDIFTMPDGSFLVNGTTYYVGVRAVDAVSNRDANLVSMSVISTGVSVAAEIYDAQGAFAINQDHQLQGTLWCLKNFALAVAPGAVMGTASYQIYDKNGVLVSGMSESGIVADANGQYKITPVLSILEDELNHYMVKITLNVDGANRQDYVPLIQGIPAYEIDGNYSVNNLNEIIGTFWASAGGEFISDVTRLGAASYVVYDSDNIIVPGVTESGIMPSADGFYAVTPVPLGGPLDLSLYKVKISMIVDGVIRDHIIPVIGTTPIYQMHSIFSINPLNQLKGTFWATSDDIIKSASVLGTAEYTVYDSAGIAIPGLTQSGMVADVNGRFHSTPVSAILLTDLTHYSVSIGIMIDGINRKSYKGFTLLGS